MDRLNYRKGHETKRLQSSPLGFSPAEQDFVYNDKNKLKKHSHFHKKKYETNSYLSGWPAQARMYPVGQRSFSTPDSSICHYSVPLSFSFEPVSLPIYSALIQPQGNYGIPARTSSNSRKSNKLCSQNRKSKGKTNTNSMHEVPAMFNTCRISNGDQQDYTSLPPVNCDVFAPKSVDNNLIFRRRFSDPGIGQLSSDDCFSSKSDDSETSSTQEPEPHDFFILIEQMNDLKKSNSNLRKELQETKLELELLKVNAQSWRSDSDDFKPGALSDAISEIRCAVKLSEEALVSKVTQMVENISEECKESQAKLEERLRQEMNEKLSKLAEAINCQSVTKEQRIPVTAEPCSVSSPGDVTIHQQLIELEQEKLQLRKELQEAVSKRKSAEATTEKLERLVGILRKKINGVSLESSMPDEKQSVVRPLASSLEKNPFIIANNRQGQKQEVLPFQKPKVIPLKAFSSENLEVTNLVGNENKENEAREAGNGNEQSSHGHPVSETASVTAQVTITGPVTDL